MNESKISKAVRAAFRDVAFPFRMGAGFQGDVNRVHPVSIDARSIALTASPPLQYGIPTLLDAAFPGNVRQFVAGDTAVTTPYGFSVRPFPQQQQTQSSASNPSPFGSIVPPVGQPLDNMRAGYMMVKLNDVAATPKAGDAIFVWCAATVGIHTQGGIEVVGSGGNTAALDPLRYTFNSSPDSSGIVEIAANV